MSGSHERPDTILKLNQNNKMILSELTDIDVFVDTANYPEMEDSYIISAKYNGVELTDEQLDEVNEDQQFVYNCACDAIF